MLLDTFRSDVSYLQGKSLFLKFHEFLNEKDITFPSTHALPFTFFSVEFQLFNVYKILNGASKVQPSENAYNRIVKEMTSVLRFSDLEDKHIQGMIFLCSSMNLFIGRSYMDYYRFSKKRLKDLGEPPFYLSRSEQVKQLQRCIQFKNSKMFPIQVDRLIGKATNDDSSSEINYPGHTIHTAELEDKHRVFKYTNTRTGAQIRTPVDPPTFRNTDDSHSPSWIRNIDDSKGWVLVNETGIGNQGTIKRCPKSQKMLSDWATSIMKGDFITTFDMQEWYCRLLKTGYYIYIHDLKKQLSEYIGCTAERLENATKLLQGTCGFTGSVEIENLQGHAVVQGDSSLQDLALNNVPQCHCIDSLRGEYEDLDWARTALYTHMLMTFNVFGKDPWFLQYLEVDRPGTLILIPSPHQRWYCFVSVYIFRVPDIPSNIRISYLNSLGGTLGSCLVHEQEF